MAKGALDDIARLKAQQVARREGKVVTEKVVTDRVVIEPKVTTRKYVTKTERDPPTCKVADWRKNNKERYNAYMREYKKRKKAEAAGE